jgi:hypothetical protein
MAAAMALAVSTETPKGVKIRYVADARVHLPRYFSNAGRTERPRHV